jgi:restriction system protein
MAQKIAQYVNPVLAALKRLGGSGRPAEVCTAVAHDMGLEDSPLLEETLKSGVSKFENRVAWVRLYLVQANYIDRSKRGVWTLTL